SIEIGQIILGIHTLLFSGLFIILGQQAVFFSVFAELIADIHLYQKPKHALRLLKFYTLERGLILGLLLMFLGGLGACYAFWYWSHQAFGALAPTYMMRILIPSVTLIILGMQLLFASFFMSVLSLHYNFAKR